VFILTETLKRIQFNAKIQALIALDAVFTFHSLTAKQSKIGTLMPAL